MFNQQRTRLMLKFLTLGILVLCLCFLFLPPASREAHADFACCAACDEQLSMCEQSCIDNSGCPGAACGPRLARCRNACDAQRNSCISNCGSCE
jgi:hypothetical protein